MKDKAVERNIVRDYWNKNIIYKILIIVFLPIPLSYLFWIKVQIPKKYKIIILALAWIFFIGRSSNSNENITNPKQTNVIENKEVIKNEEEKNKGKEADHSTKDLLLNEYILDKLKEYDKDAEVSIWKGDNSITTPDNGPFDQVIVNYPLVNNFSCYYAKVTSYSIVASLYNDEKIQSKVSRVKVSIPNNLAVSIGNTDGIQLANKGLLNPNYGSSNFWDTLIQSSVNQEKEFGNYNSRTWGVFLEKCNSDLKKLFNK